MKKRRILFALTLGVVSLSFAIPATAQADYFWPPELRVINKTADRCGIEGIVDYRADNPGWIYDDVRIQRKRDGTWRTVARKSGTSKVYGYGDSNEFSARVVRLGRQSQNAGRYRAKYYYRYTSGGVVRKQGGLIRPFDETRCKLG